MDDLIIEQWIQGANWCPNPDSAREMQLDFKLIRHNGSLIIGYQRKRAMQGVVQLPDAIAQRLELIHQAGASVDVGILDSIPSKRAVLVSIFVACEELEEHAGQIQHLRADQRRQEAAQREHARRIEEELNAARAARRARRREHVRKLIRSIGSGIRRGTHSAIVAARDGWRWLVEWTNR